MSNAADIQAFPSTYSEGPETEVHDRGMSLRDYFAAKAMQSWITAAPTLNGESEEHAELLAAAAYLQADAMLKIRFA